MNDFDAKAKDWDNNPAIVERAVKIAEAIRKTVDFSRISTGFEYGSGTGLLSFNLSSSLKEIVLADSSIGMLEVLNTKISKTGIKNMRPMLLDLEKGELVGDKFDIIYTQMTLHHIPDTGRLLTKFYGMLNNGGYLCIADLYSEDGSFHGEGFSGHRGFEPEELKANMQKIGFSRINYGECHRMKKDVGGIDRSFPIFLLTGRKI
jgi:2-polyprenyl-3-methyl-5-hydroxy-6-metoxy-1,4-benzoquinol methylase